MPTYQEIVDLFKDNNCELVTTKDQYNSFKGDRLKQVVEFYASCSHYNKVTLVNFKYKKSGVLCKDCVYKNTSKKLKDKSKDVDESLHQEQEYNGINMLTHILSNDFHVKKTNEGCLADILIKPKYEYTDKWAFIQVKTTKELCHGLYTFSFHENIYKDCCVICICIDEQKIWVVDYTFTIGKHKLNIGKTNKSEYFKYMVPGDNLAAYMHNWYSKNRKFKEEYGMMPISPYQQKEQEFRRWRENQLPYIAYIYPEIDGRKTDFYINEQRIQEKVATRRHDRKYMYTAGLYRTCCNKNAKSYYKIGDNNFYWIWLGDDKNIFYIFPEDIMIDQGYIQKDINTKPETKMLCISMHNWTKKYRYSLEDVNLKTKIENIFLNS